MHQRPVEVVGAEVEFQVKVFQQFQLRGAQVDGAAGVVAHGARLQNLNERNAELPGQLGIGHQVGLGSEFLGDAERQVDDRTSGVGVGRCLHGIW